MSAYRGYYWFVCLAGLFLSKLMIAPAVSAMDRLTIAGSSTIQPVAEVLAQEFEQFHPDARLDVQGGGSAVGITASQNGLADIGMVSRSLHVEEARRLAATTFALDGIALIAHTSNPLSNLTHQQVIDIYSGVLARWSALGGPDSRIIVVNKEEGRATLELFEQYFGLRGKFARDAVIIGPNGQAIVTVAGNPYAIAYVSIGAAEVAVAQGTSIKLLTLDGVAATTSNVRNGSYGLLRQLNFVTSGSPLGTAKAFLDFVLTPTGQHIVAEQEFVPVRDSLAQQ